MDVSKEKSNVYDLHVSCRINGHRAVALIDSGSTHDFISEDFARKISLATDVLPETSHVKLADGSSMSRPLEVALFVKVVIKDFNDIQQLTGYPLTKYDVILGKLWQTRHNPKINFD